jgi:tyrosyl-tRNA synthetase
MKLSEELQYRGFINQSTFQDLAKLDSKKFVLYLGTDPTGASLHIGHLASQLLARQFLEHGHKVILLVGGGTGMIGDPRDTEERNLISIEELNSNKAKLAEQVKRIWGGRDFELVDNFDWLKDVALWEFLRDIGKHFSMGQLVDREHFKARVGEGKSGMSFAEFTYTLLQGYDYLWLHRNKGVNLQIGGSDQWGNIMSGVELVRKKDGDEVDALTLPLVIDKTTGRKFGKTEAGDGVWLDPKRTSPYEFYQFWLNVSDDNVIDYLKLFTLLPRDEIEEIAGLQAKDPASREAQKRLTLEVTEIVHGRDTAVNVAHITNVLFGDGDINQLPKAGLELLSQTIPTVVKNTTVIQALTSTGVCASNGEAQRLIKGGGVSLNGAKLLEDQKVTGLSLIKKGKNQFILVK